MTVAVVHHLSDTFINGLVVFGVNSLVLDCILCPACYKAPYLCRPP